MAAKFDVVIVGAGLAGLQMLYHIRELGLTARVFEAGGDAGGTWYWNRYPGARCDVESLEYSYQFSEELQQEWEWTRRYATQPEILSYINHVAERFDLRQDIRFDTRVTALTYDTPPAQWTVCTDAGEEVVAQFVIMATGCLSATNMPDIAGMESFAGEIHHTGHWPLEPVDLSGKRVGVIGTGSSGIQVIPKIAQEAQELYVFQRTPAYTLPANDEPLDPEMQAAIKADYAGFRERNDSMPAGGLSRFPTNPNSIFLFSEAEREDIFEHCWARGGPLLLRAFSDAQINPGANELVAEFVRKKIRQIVKDPDVAELLSPKYVIGCKRICLGDGYYETFNRDNVHLIDVASETIERITPDGVRTAADEYGLDALVFATGYDAITGALTRIDVRGRDGRSLNAAWSEGAHAYLGLGVPGFPNLFTITGPGSPSVLTNMLVAIHQHATWIRDCLKYLIDNDIGTIEATSSAAQDWVRHVNDVADKTLLPTCGSWYLGANIPGKKRVFLPLVGFPAYARKCDEVAANGYQGFVLTRNAESTQDPNGYPTTTTVADSWPAGSGPAPSRGMRSDENGFAATNHSTSTNQPARSTLMEHREAPEIDFDHHSEEYGRDPWVANISMNTQCPVAHSSHYGGFWAVTGYEQVAAVARQPQTFSSAHELPNVPGRPQGTIIPPTTFRALPLEMDPPEFLEWRRALNRFFSPTAAQQLRPRIEAYATWCIDQFVEQGEIDLVLDLANAVPALLTLDIVGLPMANWRVYADAVHSLAYTPADTPEYKQVEEGFAMLIREVVETIPQRREHPKSDLISFLTQIEIGGEKISDEDIIAVCNAMIAGGMDTTTALLASTFEYLDRDRSARRRLMDDHSMIPKACEEFLRYFTPVVCVGRTAMQDTEIDGVQVPSGDRVLLSWMAANLDAKVFPDPLTIDFDRDTRKHAAFGIGMHRCIGRHIAHTDFQVVLTELLRRLPDYQLVEGTAERYPTVGQINGYVKMPARFNPGPRTGPDFATAEELHASLG